MNKLVINWEIRNISTEKSYEDIAITSYQLFINGSEWTTVKCDFYVDEYATYEDEETCEIKPNPKVKDFEYLVGQVEKNQEEKIKEELSNYIFNWKELND